MTVPESFAVYQGVADRGRSVLIRRRQWWQHNKLGLQVSMLAANLVVLFVVLFAAWRDVTTLVTPAVVLLAAGMLGLLAVGVVPRALEYVESDYPAVVRVGCRAMGGAAFMPAAMLDVQGPLRGDVRRFLAEAALDERERECFEVLRQQWEGTLDELLTTVRSLSRQDRTVG